MLRMILTKIKKSGKHPKEKMLWYATQMYNVAIFGILSTAVDTIPQTGYFRAAREVKEGTHDEQKAGTLSLWGNVIIFENFSFERGHDWSIYLCQFQHKLGLRCEFPALANQVGISSKWITSVFTGHKKIPKQDKIHYMWTTLWSPWDTEVSPSER